MKGIKLKWTRARVNTFQDSKTLSKIDRLKDRGAMFAKARAFFAERNVLEVDCPILGGAAPIDLHIEIISTSTNRYLHSSPEYGMKRLLAQGVGDIYQLGHVFRKGEVGRLHNPEFTMAEWYRHGFTFEELLEETLDFIRLFLGPLPSRVLTYKQAIELYTKDAMLPEEAKHWDEEARSAYLMGFVVEPQIGQDELTVIIHFPAAQAALARTTLIDGELVAERFEIYYRGTELANGYHELTDAAEQRTRLHLANDLRKRHNKPALPIDENFLSALQQGLPDCCGVAVGFDRLMLLRHDADSLADILPFHWEEA